MKPVMSNRQRTWLRHVLASRMKSTFVVPALGAGLIMGAAALPGNVANATTVSSGTYTNPVATSDPTNPSVANGSGTYINYGTVGDAYAVGGGIFNNKAGATVGSNAYGQATTGAFNNAGSITGQAIVTSGLFRNKAGGTVTNSANVSGGTFYGLGGTVAGGISLTSNGAGNVGEALVTGDGPHASPVGSNAAITDQLDVGKAGNSTTGVANGGSGTFSVGGGSIGAIGTPANDNDVTNTLNYLGTGNAVENSGSGNIAVGNGAIYGDGNVVSNIITVNGASPANGDIHQTGTGSTNIGGADIHGDGNTVTNNVGAIIATNGNVYSEFNTLHSSNNVSVTNLGHQNLSGGAQGHYGDSDVVLPAYSDNNSDTINIDGIEADDTGSLGTSVNIGGGRHTVTGDGNDYEVNVNTRSGDPYALELTNGATADVAAGASSANSITGTNNTFANTISGNVNVSSGSSLTLFGGNNSVLGNGSNNNQFTNTITGDVGVVNAKVTLDAGVLNASNNPSIASNNSSGNTIGGTVTLTNGSQAYITGQTTDVNSGSNSSFNNIQGAFGLNVTNSAAHFSGHNNTIDNGVAVGANSLVTVYQQDLTGQSNLTLENSITGDVTVNGDPSILAIGVDALTPYSPGNTTTISGNGNTITNTVHGTVAFDATNGGRVVETSQLNVTGNNNHINNTLTQDFDLNSTAGSSIYQTGFALAATGNNNQINNSITGDVTVRSNSTLEQYNGSINATGANNQINNTITGDVTVDGGLFVQQGGHISGYDNSGNGGSSSGYSATDNNGNQITNTVDGHVTVQNGGDFLIDGERNIVTGGVDDRSNAGTHIGSGDVNDTGATIHNESTADHSVSGGGHLHLGTNPGPSTQQITGSNNTILNRVKGDSGLGIEGSITVTGAGSVLGLGDGLSDSGALNINGGGNVITNSVASANTASGNAQLQTVTNGGEVLLGGRDITSSSTGNVINNSVTQDVTLGANSGDSGYLELAGTGTGSTTGANAATVNNTITGNVTANGGSTVYLYGSNGSNAINTITGAVNLNDDSYLQAYDGGTAANGNVVTGSINLNSNISDGVIVGINQTGTGITRDHSLRGDIHLLNGNTSNVYIGESITNNGASANAITNTHVGSIAPSDANAVSNSYVVLGGAINNTSTGGTSLANQQTGDVTMRGGNVQLTGSFFQPTGPISSISNTITGDVKMNSSGSLYLFSVDDISNNVSIINNITGSVTLNDSTGLLASGADNTINLGLNLNDTSQAQVGGGDTATGLNVTNILVVNGSGVVVSGNPNSYYDANGNTYFDGGDYGQSSVNHGYTTDSGHVFVGGGSNTATTNSITNKLDANVTLNGHAGYHFDGSNSYFNSGGLLKLGGASNALNTGGSVTNEVTGTVNLHGGSRLFMGGESITGDGTGSVTNKIDSNVNADGNSYISIIGDHNPDDGASTVNNTLSGQLNTYNNVLTEVSGGGNSVTGGVTLYNNSVLHLSAQSSWSQTYQNELTSNITLNNSSNLVLGNQPTAGSTMAATNLINGNVAANNTSDIKVLSGGSGGLHSADTNEINGNLTLQSGTHFDVNLTTAPSPDGAISTGVAVDGTSTLNGATVRVTDIDPINYANGHADFTFGRRHTLVQALGAGSVANGFATNAQLYDVNGNSVYAPALDLTTGWDSSSAYLDWLTDFHDVANTTNQRNFGQYLDDLVANSLNDGIDPSSRLSTVLNYLVSRDPSAMNDFTGDSYSAFDMAGYWNANRFANEVATHARQSHDNDWTESFALNAKNGLSGVGAQMSLVKQLLNSRPTMQLNAKSDGGMWGNDNGSSNNALWGNVSGTRLNNDGDSSLGSPDWDLSTKSVAIGYQGGGNSFSWGITGGYHNGDINFNNRHADGDNDGWNAGLNGLWKSKSNTYVSGLLTYGHESNSLTRNDGLGTNKSDFNSKTYAAMLEVGKRINKKTYNFTPYVSLLGVKYDRDALSESGSGAGVNSSLDVNGESHSYLTSSLGVRIGRDYLDKSGQKKGGIMLGANWQHQFSSTDFPVTAALQGAAGMVPGSYTTYGTPLASDSLGIQLGAYGRLSSNIFGFLNYSGNFGGDQKINSITAGLQYGF